MSKIGQQIKKQFCQGYFFNRNLMSHEFWNKTGIFRLHKNTNCEHYNLQVHIHEIDMYFRCV